MDRRVLLFAVFFGLAPVGTALAASYEESVVAQLQTMGYGQIVVEHTLLGRVRILAILDGEQREIILNPRTGEVLRDVVTGSSGTVTPQIARVSGKAGDGSGSSSDGSGANDGSDDDGSGNGGSGSGGSGGGGSDDGGSDVDNSGSDGTGGGGSGSGGSGDGSSGGSEDHESESDGDGGEN